MLHMHRRASPSEVNELKLIRVKDGSGLGRWPDIRKRAQFGEWEGPWKPALPNQFGKNPLTPLPFQRKRGPCRPRLRRRPHQHQRRGRLATVCLARVATPTILPTCPPVPCATDPFAFTEQRRGLASRQTAL